MTPFSTSEVAAKFQGYPPRARRRLLALRELVFLTSDKTLGVDAIDETLKWGQPAYVTRQKTGSTFRLDWLRSEPECCAVYFHCQTDLVDSFRALFPRDFRFEGNRALVLALNKRTPRDALAMCIAMALTYHSRLGQAM